MGKGEGSKGAESTEEDGSNDLPPTRKDLLRLEKKIEEQQETIRQLRSEREVPPPKKGVSKPDKRRGLFADDWDDEDEDDGGEE